MGITLSRLTFFAICLWLGLLFYISSMLVRVQQQNAQLTAVAGELGEGEGDTAVQDALYRIKQAGFDIEALKKQNEELKYLLYQSSRIPKTKSSQNSIPGTPWLFGTSGHFSQKHEEVRRRVENGVQEMWYFFRGQVKKILSSTDQASHLKTVVEGTLKKGEEQFQNLFADTLQLADVDGANHWRRMQLENLTKLVQKRFDSLQNPEDCASSRRLQCNLNKGCGFGCQIHHAAYCFMLAYATERTLILDTRGWRYSRKGWTSVFKPVSRTCKDSAFSLSSTSAAQWKGPEGNKADLVVSVPIVESLRPRLPALPLSFPEEFAHDLLHLHGNPPVWWIGQFMWYLMRYSDEMKQELEQTERALNFRGPIVGLHVRRTDKLGSEAQYHSIEEYMDWTERWFRVQELREGKELSRRVFLATDEPTVFQETQKKYKNYQVLGSRDIAKTAQLSSRYTDASLHGVLVDIHLLSRTNYIVCTFSSQVCRVAYELMQAFRGDWAERFQSLDDVYYFGGQEGHEQTVVLPHNPVPLPPNHIKLDKGDVVGLAGNHWDGYSKGRNTKTQETGLYPSYKVKEKWRIVKLPTYPNVRV